MDAPFPLWMVFPVIFALLYVSHFSLLRLPYYWDEAGYYIPAAWDFFRTGSLIPVTTMSNAHPPLAQRLPCAVVEAFRLLPRSDPGSRIDDCLHRPSRRLASGASCRRFRSGRLLDSRADGAVPHLVCAEHPRPG